jgi:hypothetical protein
VVARVYLTWYISAKQDAPKVVEIHNTLDGRDISNIFISTGLKKATGDS